MEIYWFEPKTYDLLYNCSFFSVDSIPVEMRQHKNIGIVFISLFVIFEIMYIPVLIVFRTQSFFSQSAYKLMFYIGIIDIGALVICAFFTGLFSYWGTVFCIYPHLIYILGVIGLCYWIAASDMALVLACNRFVAMWDMNLNRVLFDNGRVYFWMGAVFCHVLITFFFINPILFNSMLISWFGNPYQGYYPDDEFKYFHPLLYWHNILVCMAYFGLYLAFIAVIVYKRYYMNSSVLKRKGSQRQIFFQVMIICITNTFGASIYTYMQFFPVTQMLILAASFTWVSVHGMPSIGCLLFNKTVRRSAVRIFLCRNTYVAPSTRST